jgi:glycosyltransferase involved in cell wall biosynthesis
MRQIRKNAATAASNVLLDPSHKAFLPSNSVIDMITPTLVSVDQIADDPPSRTSNSPMRIIYAGRLTSTKGVERVIALHGACVAKDLNVLFKIAGDGPLKDHVQQKAAVTDGLEFLGNLNPSQLSSHLRSSHVMVLLSDSEGMPKILWEAFAAGLPVMSTSVGGVPNVVIDGVNGCLVTAEDIDTQVQYITHLAEDDSLRQAQGVAALQSIGQNSREQQATLLASVLNRIIAVDTGERA